MVAIVITIAAIALLWLVGSQDAAWDEAVAKVGPWVLLILLVFPVLYGWHFIKLASPSQSDTISAVLVIALGSLVTILGLAIIGAGAWQLSKTEKSPPVEYVPPELEPLRDTLILQNPPLILGIDASPSGDRITQANVHLHFTNGGKRALTYTVHKFRGTIEGFEMPDVDGPNPGGEVLPNEPRSYTGGLAKVDIGPGPFEGEVEWDIRYGANGIEPFRFARRVAFKGVYNPQTRRGEQLSWSWKPLSKEVELPASPLPQDTESEKTR